MTTLAEPTGTPPTADQERRPPDSADIRRKVRDFVTGNLLGRPDNLDNLSPAPLPIYDIFRDTGLANWWLPERHGGLNVSLEDSVDLVSELAYGDAGVAFTLFVPILSSTLLALYGSAELQRSYLRPMARTGGFCAILGSEQAAGSELDRMDTTVTRDGSHLIVDGDKYFASNADFADFLVVIAVRADNPLVHLAVVVPRDTPGIHIRKRWGMNGLRSSATYQVTLENCRVPAANALDGPGLSLLEVGLNATRTLIATTAIGISRRIRDISIEYAKAKSLRGSTLFDHPGFAGKIGQMEMQIEVMRNQCLTAAREFDTILNGPDAAGEFLRRGTFRSALSAKMFCGQVGWDIAGVGSQMFGGLGFTDELIIGKLVRDIRYVSIVEGGDDVTRELIFRRYASPAFKRI